MNFICRQCGGLLLGGHPATELKQCSCHVQPKPKRDIQFKGFAEKLYQEIEDLTCSFSVLPSADEMKRLECEIYARRAYDLVEHATWHIPYARELDDVVSYVRDLTELPKEQEA